jgi:hypothetical protein
VKYNPEAFFSNPSCVTEAGKVGVLFVFCNLCFKIQIGHTYISPHPYAFAILSKFPFCVVEKREFFKGCGNMLVELNLSVYES